MEETEYKLNSQNPILIFHAISKIVESITKMEYNTTDNSQDLFKNSKMKFLLLKCQSEDTLVSTTACLGLVTLVETRILSINTALSTLISNIGFTKNYSALISATNSLLILDLKNQVTEGSYICSFELNSPQHPFITVLNHEKEIWKDILTEMRFVINHDDPMVSTNSAQLLRPVFLYILSNPKSNLSETCREETWNLLIKSKMINLKLEILQWLCTRDFSSLLDSNHRLLELAKVTILTNDHNFSSALMPIIAYFGVKILKKGFDPRLNLEIINEIGKNNYSSSCLTITILSSSIAECPVIYLFNLVETCIFLLKKGSCSVFVAYKLLASLLQWQPYRGSFLSDILNVTKTLIDKILSQQAWKCDTEVLLSNEIFLILIDSFSDLQFYTQLCNINYQSQEEILSWLKNVSRAPTNFKQELKYFFYGLLLYMQDYKVITSICHILLQVSDSNLTAWQILPLILYKLSKCRNFEEIYNLLIILPELSTAKENFFIIVRIFETFLNFGEPLKQLAIELYCRAWKREARFHNYLVTVLINVAKQSCEFHSEIVCAKVMMEMCELRPESITELAPLLSNILIRRIDTEGAVMSALALKGISALCKSGIIDIFTTWKVLAPKFEKEKRSFVLRALCEFISEVPSYTSLKEDNVINLLKNFVSHLWRLIFYSKDIEVSKAAFTALKFYNFQLLSTKLFPPEIIPINHNLTQNLVTDNIETNLSSDDIPGTYWIRMLENLNSNLLFSAGDLLIEYIEFEVKFLPKIQRESTNYDFLPNKSIVKAIGQSLMTYEPSNSHQRTIVTELLRIFANKYSNPLPNVRYDFLQKYKFSEKIKEYIFRVVSNQAEVSPSAKKILEQYLTVATNEVTDPKELSFFYSNLESICKGASSDILQKFLEVSLIEMVHKSLSGDKNYIQGFEKAMHSFQRTLKDKTQPENIQRILVSILEILFERVNEDSIFESYLFAILNCPKEDLLRITSADWNNDNVTKLMKVILIRIEWALKQNEKESWSMVEENFQDCAFRPEIHEGILRIFLRSQVQNRLQKFDLNKILTSMNRIQSFILNLNPEKNSEVEVAFLCDILFISVCCLSGVDCFLSNKELLIQSKAVRLQLFPLGFFNLVKYSYSKESISKIMMWLHYMRTTNHVSFSYKRAFHSTLVFLKNEKHFMNDWMTFVSLKSHFWIPQ